MVQWVLCRGSRGETGCVGVAWARRCVEETGTNCLSCFKPSWVETRADVECIELEIALRLRKLLFQAEGGIRDVDWLGHWLTG